MQKAVSCGGVVIFRGKILTLYKNYKNRYEGWVLPKGTVEQGEEKSINRLHCVKCVKKQELMHILLSISEKANIILTYQAIQFIKKFIGI